MNLDFSNHEKRIIAVASLYEAMQKVRACDWTDPETVREFFPYTIPGRGFTIQVTILTARKKDADNALS